jgi:hypothetical protein
VAAALTAPAAAHAQATVTDGEARFQVLTPSLVRVEYAADGRFEDRPTLNAIGRERRAPRVRVTRTAETLRIRTSRMTVRYRRGSGPFGGGNLVLALRVGRSVVTASPEFPPAPPPGAGPPSTEVQPYTVREDPDYAPRTEGNLGGWYRALDLAGGPVGLHDGLLSRDGWYLLDDTRTVLLSDAPPGFAVRPEREGAYQDGYLFGYGRDYARGLADLRALTGAAPLLPRSAFGVWFSRYFAYRQSDYAPLLARFRAENVPLDVLMVDTDFKAPHAWNGWSWLPELFPDPRAFFAWAQSEGIDVGLNTHPSIATDDPRLAEAERRAGRPLPADPTGARCRTFVAIGDSYGRGTPGASVDCRVFDWASAGDQDAYFWLHEPFEREGADFWWLDYCCDESHALAPGLTQDTWINHLYAERARARGSRWPVLSRVGASVFDPDEAGAGIWAEHRNAIHFTGDARPTWEMLDFQTAMNAAEGSVGIPYVSHDIGGFGAIASDGTTGRHLPDDLYVRWVQAGAFGSILRLHSDHGDRLPWDYPGRAQEIATRFLRLRGELVPYLYSLAREAHDRGLPITRASYLAWPGHDEAYAFDRQYMLGPHLLVAPVATPGEEAEKEVWLPPGVWVDFFSGERHRGPAVLRMEVPLERMPVFARAGAVVPTQRVEPRPQPAQPDPLVVTAWAGADGAFTLYEDAGDGLEHTRGERASTRLRFDDRRRRGAALTIGPARGRFPGMRRRRAYELRIVGARRPRRVTLNGRRARSRYDAASRTLTIRTGRLPSRRTHRVVAEP